MNIDEQLYKKAAIIILQKRLKIKLPTQHQINEMVELLSYVWLKRTALLDNRLTEKEKLCLLFSSQGNTAGEIAELLGVSITTVKSHRKEILRKLSCKTMTQAAVAGLRYGFVLAETSSNYTPP